MTARSNSFLGLVDVDPTGLADQQGFVWSASRRMLVPSTAATGPAGAPGAQGLSAYQVWLAAGNTGSVNDYLASLKGATGAQGAQGQTGAAGAQGQQGNAGATGQTGATGATGPIANSGDPAPADFGLLSWTLDPAATAGASGAATAGVVQLVRARLDTAQTISNVIAFIQTVSSGLSAFYVGLYSPAGALLASSANQQTLTTAGGRKAFPLSTPYAAASGLYWIAFLGVGTTNPALMWSNGGRMVESQLPTRALAAVTTGASTLPNSLTMTAGGAGGVAGASTVTWLGLA